MKSGALDLLLVGTGGFIGAILRYVVGGLSHRLFSDGFPHGTLVVNVLGCLVIGLLAGMGETRPVFSNNARLFLFIGVLGGFTTFSSFSLDTITLLRESDHLKAFLNLSFHLVLCLGATVVGFAITSAD